MCRIAVDVSILEEPRWTGVERCAAGLVRALGAAGGDEVLLYSRGPVPWRFPIGGRLVPRPLGGPRAFAVWRETSLVRALRRDGVALLHSPVAAIPLLTRVPRSATVHEMPWLRHPGIEGRGRELRYRLRIKAAARAAALLVAPSETVARDLHAFCPGATGKTAVLPFGVEEIFRPLGGEGWREEARLRLALPHGPMVLFVGRPRRKKNLPVLVDAVERLRRAMRPAPSLVLAGVTARDLRPGPGVQPLGFVADADLVRLYNLASVLAYPSLSEGFGLPPLEAMACGTPVVASSAGAVPEVVRDAALLVDPASPADLAEAIRAAIEDAPLRRSLAARGSARVRAYTWAGAGARALELFDAVAA